MDRAPYFNIWMQEFTKVKHEFYIMYYKTDEMYHSGGLETLHHMHIQTRHKGKKNEDAYERTMMIIIVAQGTSYKHRCRPLGFSKKEVGYHRPMAVVLSYSHTIDCHHCPSMKK